MPNYNAFYMLIDLETTN